MSGYKHVIYWRDTEPVDPGPRLEGTVDCDVCIVGGGYTGMWTAYQLLQAEPALDICILEADYAGCGASGHNDGFVTPTLGKDIQALVDTFGADRAAQASAAVGRSILDIGRFCRRNKVDADYEATDYLLVAVDQRQVARLERDRDLAARLGSTGVQLLGRDEAQQMIGSPAIQAAMPTSGAIVNPHRLARGLARVVREKGVALYEGTPALRVEPGAGRHTVVTPAGRVTAEKVVFATNAYQHVFPQFRRKVLPVWSYAMVSEPLTDEQISRVEWPGREGLVEAKTFLNCGRFTAENRILWGGGRASYFFGRDMDERHMRHMAVYRELRGSFDKYFPMWRDVRFEYAYGGAVAITRDLVPHFGSLGPGLFYGYGYCGNGIAATHTGGQVLRDLVLGKETDYSTLLFVNRKERSCPPEPFAYVGAQAMTRMYEWKDAHT